MDHFVDQNLPLHSKMVDCIEVKNPILSEINEERMKKRKQQKPFYKPMSTKSEYFDNIFCDFSEPYSIIRKKNWFHFSIQDNLKGVYYAKLITT